MKLLANNIYLFFLFSIINIGFSDVEANKEKVDQAIRVISDPSIQGREKYDAFIDLQEFQSPRAIEALYEQIDFISIWETQRVTESIYPATYALILIGDESVRGAEKHLKTRLIKNPDKLRLITHVVQEIFRKKSGDPVGDEYPKTDEMLLSWIKENYDKNQIQILSQAFYFPPLKEYLTKENISEKKAFQKEDNGEKNISEDKNYFKEKDSESKYLDNLNESAYVVWIEKYGWLLGGGIGLVAVFFLIGFKEKK